MSRRTDRELGMNCRISRRDFLHGAGALAIGFSSRPASPQRAAAGEYPPGATGLRGSHRGSFEVAHALADGERNFPTAEDASDAVYDLLVVGAGLSGLSAAYFYRQQHPDARILVLDNHDDFGGHAKRNEMRVGNSILLAHGGSQTLESPSRYSKVASKLVRDVGIDLSRFEQAYDHDFFRRHGLAGSVYFDRHTFGVDKVVRQAEREGSWIPLSHDAPARTEAISDYPITEEARAQLHSLYSGDAAVRHPDWKSLPLRELSYLQLLDAVGVRHPQALKVLDGMAAPLVCVGIDAIPAAYATGVGLPSPAGLPPSGPGEPYIHHFPDGNASLARLLVRGLVPKAMPGTTMDDVVVAKARYDLLDHPDGPVRIRLNSTVVDVAHAGGVKGNSPVEVVYVNSTDGVTRRVRGRHCVLACYNMVIPYICSELPEEQKQALSSLVKSPLVYTNVALTNWRSWKSLGIGMAYSPGRWHHYAYLDFPVSMGGYQYSQGPDEPIVIHMDWEPRAPGQPMQEQFREGRRTLLKTQFSEIEREVRDHLAGMLGAGGFDPATDIAALTVNRWPHGYSAEGGAVAGNRPHVTGRQPHGRITIANSDSGARAYADAAIDQAWRAVEELPG